MMKHKRGGKTEREEHRLVRRPGPGSKKRKGADTQISQKRLGIRLLIRKEERHVSGKRKSRYTERRKKEGGDDEIAHLFYPPRREKGKMDGFGFTHKEGKEEKKKKKNQRISPSTGKKKGKKKRGSR